MTHTTENKYRICSAWIIICGLLYIFAYQFKWPFKADLFLYGMVIGLVAMAFLANRVIINKQFILFLIIDVVAFFGILRTKNTTAGLREAILFAFFAGTFALSLVNPAFIKAFVKWIYLISVFVILSSLLQFLIPDRFNEWMRSILRSDAYSQHMWSYVVDSAFAGIAAYTPNTTFSAAIVFGHSFLSLSGRKDGLTIKNKAVNVALMVFALLTIVLCSKRGVFVATILAAAVLMCYIYRNRNLILRIAGALLAAVVALMVLYQTNDYVRAFLNRFLSEDFTTGRAEIYHALLTDLQEGNLLIGMGTGATYALAEKGAHNIYLQILYDHGILLSIPYYAFLIYNYYLAFKKNSPLSVFVQTLFLVYGLTGNPLYSNMFMMIYIYYVLYSVIEPDRRQGDV